MTAAILDRRSEAHSLQEAVWLTARKTVDYDMVKRTVRGERISDLPSLYPYDFFRKAVIEGAKEFVNLMRRQPLEYELAGNEVDMQVWAPLRTREFQPVVKASMKQVQAYERDEWPFPKGRADVVIGGWFKAKYAVPTEWTHLPPEPQEEEE